MVEKYAVIVAGGSGTRLGGDLPKQFQSLGGRPVLWWSMKAFHDEDLSTRIILVLNKDFIGVWKSIYDVLPEEDRFPFDIALGGDSRTRSVQNGLSLVPDSADVLVAIHDGARPLVTPSMISDGWQAASTYGAAIPVIPVTDSLRQLSPPCSPADSTGLSASHAVDRNNYVAVQTPQVFKASVLKEAYAANPSQVFTDDASAAEAVGYTPFLFKGAPHNIKVTNPGDIEMATLFLSNS